MKLSIVLPTYNEYDNIKILIPEIEDAFRNVMFEIIVVDDDSPDKTGEFVQELNREYGNIRLIRRTKKTGIGSALRDGYNYAEGEIILSSDADLSFSVKDMVKLANMIQEGYDLAIGCRHAITGSYYEIRNFRTALKGSISKLGNVILRILTGIEVHDFSANFRAIRSKVWRELNLKENTNIMLFEMIIKTRYLKKKISEVPVAFTDRVHGKSKLRLSTEIPKFIIKMMYYIFKYK